MDRSGVYEELGDLAAPAAELSAIGDKLCSGAELSAIGACEDDCTAELNGSLAVGASGIVSIVWDPDWGSCSAWDSCIASTLPPRGVCALPSLPPGLRSRVVRMLKTSCNLAVSRLRLLASASSVGVTLRSSLTRLSAAIRSCGVASRIARGLSRSQIRLCLLEALRTVGSLTVSSGGGRLPSVSAADGVASVAALDRDVSGLKSMRLDYH